MPGQSSTSSDEVARIFEQSSLLVLVLSYQSSLFLSNHFHSLGFSFFISLGFSALFLSFFLDIPCPSVKSIDLIYSAAFGSSVLSNLFLVSQCSSSFLRIYSSLVLSVFSEFLSTSVLSVSLFIHLSLVFFQGPS